MKKIDLSDVSILIPVRIDSKDRARNLSIVAAYLNKYFIIKILVLESAPIQTTDERTVATTLYNFNLDEDPLFWRTKILNELIGRCSTPFAMIYDTDVIFDPLQLLRATELLRNRAVKFVLPYDGRFLQVDKYTKNVFERSLDIDYILSSVNMFKIGAYLSVGGCFAFNTETYRECGLENQFIRGWGHDDVERTKRVNKLGFRVQRIPGPIFHLYHPRSENSFFFDENSAKASFDAYFSVCSSHVDSLKRQITNWPWLK